MASSLLCRHNAADLVGAAYDATASSVVVTKQGDGVTAFDLTQKQLWSLPLGSRSTLEFQVPSVHHSTEPAHDDGPRRSLVASVVHDRATKHYSLCLQSARGPTRAISDAASRVLLPGPAQSCHLLRRTQPSGAAPEDQQSLAAAVVLADGRLGVTDLSAEPSSSSSSSSSRQLALVAADRPMAPRHILAASTHDTLIVATQQSAGTPVALRVLRLTGSGETTSLNTVKTLALPCPGPAGAHAVPTGLTASPAFALLQWSHGYASAVHALQGGAAAPLRPSHFPLADAVGANGASSSAPAAATPNPSASGRKRKSTAAGGLTAGSRPRILCAAVDDGQFLVLDLESSAAQSQVCYSLHDAQFGCPLSSGAMDIDAPLLSLDPTQCSVVAAGPEVTVVRLGGSVHVLHVRTQPVSLLSLVARLSVSASAAAAAAAGAHSQAKQPSTAGGRTVAGALASVPVPVSLDPGLLAGSAPGAPAAAAAGGAAAGAAAEDLNDVDLLPVPATSVTRVEDICKSLIDQLTAVLPPAVPSTALLESAVSYIAGRRTHGMAVPSQLLSLTARGLAAAKQWSQLGSLLTHTGPGELAGCSEVLVAAVAAHELQLLSRLCTCLDEVEPSALVAALQHLLAPTTKANLPARQRYHQGLRSAAEAAVADAERMVTTQPGSALTPQHRASRGAAGGRQASAVALAQCAAAAVDGFSFREAALHPLVAIPMDAPAVQVALRGLSGPAADALLGYLAKWAAKYTGGTLGEAAASAVLPQALLFPYYHQVLEWTRMTIDAHLTRLLMSRTPLPALEALEATLKQAVEGNKVLLMLRGALEHIGAAAPLPAAHLAVATQYTAEVLDLRVR